MSMDWIDILLDTMFIRKQGASPKVHLEFARKILSEDDYSALLELVKEETK